MSKGKVKLVVFKEHTLGYIFEELPNYVQVLHASTLRGAPFKLNPDSEYILNESDVRLASEKDFKDYRVCFKGFDDKETYIYAE